MNVPMSRIAALIFTLILFAGVCASESPPPSNTPAATPVPARTEPCQIDERLELQLMGGEINSVVCFSWSENGEEREFTAEGAPYFGTVDGGSRSLPPVGQTVSIWNEDILVVSGTGESVATAYVEGEGQGFLNRWETYVRFKAQE